MAKVILKTDQTETAAADILGTDTYGEYQMSCTVYGTAPVTLQIRGVSGTWNNARFDGEEIQFTSVGDTFDVKLTRGFDYRLKTATAGAQVEMDKHDPHG